jgi:hypothetical protein
MQSAFAPLTPFEEKEDWGKEFRISQHFFHDLDLYRTISTLKRAHILLPPTDISRRGQIEYQILYCYFLGKKYQDLLDEFDKSSLKTAGASFPAFKDLLIMLYESYRNLHKEKEKDQLFEFITTHYPEMAEKLATSSALLEGDLTFIKKKPELTPFYSLYEREKKSSREAQILNALLPGSGYYYLGLKRTSVTALLMNGLFIAATYEFFHRGYVAAGIITASFEAGWYFGGIYGAAEEAKFFNERIYEKNATPYMNQEKLFPLLMFSYGF